MMRIKLLILGFCLSLSSIIFASNQHVHPEANDNGLTTPAKNLKWAGYCEIEIINGSYEDLRVYGIFDDGLPMEPFNIYSFENAHYISLYYYGYCHPGMDLYIDTWSGYHIYAGYTPRRRTIRVMPYLTNQVKADVSVN